MICAIMNGIIYEARFHFPSFHLFHRKKQEGGENQSNKGSHFNFKRSQISRWFHCSGYSSLSHIVDEHLTLHYIP
jgi:hypothetical protein